MTPAVGMRVEGEMQKSSEGLRAIGVGQTFNSKSEVLSFSSKWVQMVAEGELKKNSLL